MREENKKLDGKVESGEGGKGLWRRLYRVLLVKVSIEVFIVSDIGVGCYI